MRRYINRLWRAFFGKSESEVRVKLEEERRARESREARRQELLAREQLLIETLESAAPAQAVEVAQRILERRRSQHDEDRELSWLEFHTALAESVKRDYYRNTREDT